MESKESTKNDKFDPNKIPKVQDFIENYKNYVNKKNQQNKTNEPSTSTSKPSQEKEEEFLEAEEEGYLEGLTPEQKAQSLHNKFTDFLTNINGLKSFIETSKTTESFSKSSSSQSDSKNNPSSDFTQVTKDLYEEPQEAKLNTLSDFRNLTISDQNDTSQWSESKASDSFEIDPLKWNINEKNYVKLTNILNLQIETNKEEKEFLKYLTVNNFLNDLVAVDILKEAVFAFPEKTYQSLELILKWITLRFSEINPYFIYKALDYLRFLFEMMAANNYHLSDLEAEFFIPSLLENLSDPRVLIQQGVILIMKELILVYDDKKIFDYLLKTCINNPRKSVKLNCLSELGFILKNFSYEPYEPENNLNKIAKFTKSIDEDIKMTAFNVLGVCIIKYGEQVSDFLDDEYLEPLEIHVNANLDAFKAYAQSKDETLDLFREIFEAIRNKNMLIDFRIENFGQIKNMKEYLNLVVSKNLEISLMGLLNISYFLMDSQKSLDMMEHLDEILIKCSEALTNATITYFDLKGDLLNIQQIQMIILVISLIFEKRFGKMIHFEPMKTTFKSVITMMVLIDEDKEQMKSLNELLDLMFNLGDETMVMCTMIRNLNETCKDNKPFYAEIIGLIVKCLWAQLKDLSIECTFEDINRDLDYIHNDFMNKLDVPEVLHEIHLFLKDNPTSSWSKIETTCSLNILDFILRDIVKTTKLDLVKELNSYQIPKDAEIRTKIFDIIKTLK